MNQNYDKYIPNIKQIYNGNVSITCPVCTGNKHNVYIAQHQYSKTVFRFSSKECAMRNANISNVLIKHGFNVPFVNVCTFGSEYCEVYPFIKGLTLAERSVKGLSPEAIKRIYKQLIEISFDLTAIPLYEIEDDYNVNIKWQEKALDIFFNLMNNTKKQICHNDLHDKNILLDNQNNVCAILDLDSINKSSLILSIIKMLDFAKPYGFTPDDLKILYPKICTNKIMNIKHQLALYSRMHDLYWITTGQYTKNKQALQNR